MRCDQFHDWLLQQRRAYSFNMVLKHAFLLESRPQLKQFLPTTHNWSDLGLAQVCALLARMGREFVAMDPMEDQTSSCTCSEASPFNCTCPRVDPPLLPIQPMSPELIRPVSRTSQLQPTAPQLVAQWPTSPQAVAPRPIPRRPAAPRSMRGRTLVPYTGNSGPPLLPTRLNFALNHNPSVRESENMVRASESEISNIEASQRIRMESRSAERWRYIGHSIGGMVQTSDNRIMMPYIANSGPPVLNLAPNYNPGVRESENRARPSESEISNIEGSQSIPAESISHGFRPMALFIGDRIGGMVQTPDGRMLIVSDEFWRWAHGQTRLDVQNAVMEDYRTLDSMGLLCIGGSWLSRCQSRWRSG